MQRKVESSSSLQHMRTAVWNYLKTLVESKNKTLDTPNAVKASALLRLVCALKGIAAFKYNSNFT